ncbi:FtsX-like permease family protein [Roseivirga sp.]|uniref:ABC transporter permease n=1 Tax=Roseivirga sp. TaxID=1964215 RepID=UPI003B8D17B1
MFSNFLRIAIRQFSSNKIYSLINVFGLSLGLGCFILLSLFVNRETNYDEFHANKDKLYQLYIADSSLVNGPFSYSTGAPMGPAILEGIPEVTNFTRFGSGPKLTFVTDDKSFKLESIYFTDASSFEMFDIDIIAGVAPRNTFAKSDMLLSETEAMRLYGDVDDAIGKTLKADDLEEFQVIGVYKDMPENSHLAFNSLISFDLVNDLVFYGAPFVINIDAFNWGELSAFTTFVMLDGKRDLKDLAEKTQNVFQPHIGQKEAEYVRIDDIYLYDGYKGYFKSAGDRKELNLFISVGMVLLLIAIVNYMNLSTARFSKRAKEVGVRKTIGGHRNQLIFQFLIESITVTFFAMIIGVVFAEIAMPYFNSYTGKLIDVDFAAFETYLFLIGTVLFIGTVSGIYPAFYLSRFSAKQSLTQSNGGRDKSVFRKVLVGVQFAICLGLMSATYILYSQYQFMNNLDLGIDTEQVMVVSLSGDQLPKSVKSIKAEIAKSPHVDFVKAANISPLSDGAVSINVTVDGEKINSSLMTVESGLMDLLDVQISEGQLFADLPESERAKKVLVNEAFVRKMKVDSLIGKSVLGTNKVVGIVKDFIFESAKEEIKPVVITQASDADSYLYMRLNGNIKAGLADIEKSLVAFDSEYLFEYQFLDDVFAMKYEEEKRLSQVFGLFSILTIFIAGLGILGLSIFIAESRVKEIGIRKVLGAKIGQVIWLLNSGITALVLLVALIVIPLVFHFSSGWLDDFAFRIDLNPVHFILPLFTLLAVLWSILLYQAYKSAKANPVNALRTE